MRLKTNLVISVIFIALLGFVYFYEIKGGEERRVEAERQRQLLDFSDHEALRLTIDRGDTVLVLERQDGTWRLTAPVQTDADGDAVERFLRTLRETEVEGEPVQDSAAVAADPGLLAGYGLDTPRLRVHVDLPADAAPLDTVRYGDDTPTDRFTYVQRGAGANPEVLRVRAWRYDNVDKRLFDLRDRRVLAVEPSQVRRLRLQRRGEPDVEATREDGAWRLTQPVDRRGDATRLNGILTALQNARTERILRESPTAQELGASGLGSGPADIEVTVWSGDDRAEKRLRVGAGPAGADGALPALDTSRPQVFAIDSTLVGKLRTAVADLRDPQVFPVDADSVATVALEEGGRTVFSARRDTAGAWTLVEPAGRVGKTWRFNTLLNDLKNLKAARFAADAATTSALPLAAHGLDAPAWSILVTRTDGSTGRLDVGASRDGATFVLNPAVASIAAVDDDGIDGLHLSAADVSTEPPQETDADDADPGATE